MAAAAETKRGTYHHGDLRTALVDAAEVELAATGVSAFSLRRVAARVGVSHSAPSHHFGDTQGLLVALGVRAFEQLLAAMRARSDGLTDPAEQVVASALGYLDFAQANPSMFRLIFGSDRLCQGSEVLDRAGQTAFDHFARAVSEVGGKALEGAAACDLTPDLLEKVFSAWSVTHGFAEMLLAGRLDPLRNDGNARIERMLRRAILAVL